MTGKPVWTPQLGIVLCAMFELLTANPARAAEWSMLPAVDLRTEFNDNIALTSDPHPAVWGIILSPDVKFSGATETLNVIGGLRFNLNRYFGESGLDTTDHIFTVRSSYKTERDVVGLDVDSVRDSTLVSELFETGVVQARRQRNRLTANPSWVRYLTEATAVSASYSYNDVRYADTAGTSLIDYRDQTATVGLQTKLTERDGANVVAYYSRYETNPAQFQADTYGIQAGYDRAFSETLHGSVLIGARSTRMRTSLQALRCDGQILFGICLGNVTTVTSVSSERSTGYTLLATLEKKWETTQVSGRLSSDVNPTGVGALVQTDRAGLVWAQQWSPTLTSSVDGAVYQSRYLGSTVTGSNSRYFRIEPRVNWRVTEWWTLTGGYSYSRVKYENTPTSAIGNVVYLVLSYSWPKVAVSR